MRKNLSLLFLLILLPTTVFAQSDDDDWRRRRAERDRDAYDQPRFNAFELTPSVGYRWGGTIFADQSFIFDQDVDVAANPSFGLSFGIPLGDTGMKLELMASRQMSELETDSGIFEPTDEIADIDITYMHVGLQIPFARSRNAIPYAVVSAGLTNLDPDIAGVSDENKASASAGIGVKLPMSRNLSIKIEGRGYYTSLEDDEDDCTFCDYRYHQDFYQGEVNLGLLFSF
jgi:hypothetical protein